MRYKMGRPYFAWELKDKGEHKRNEALDCRNYATAAIEIINVPLKKPDKKKRRHTSKENCKTWQKKKWRNFINGRNYTGNSKKTP